MVRSYFHSLRLIIGFYGNVSGTVFVFTVNAQWEVPEFAKQLAEVVTNQFVEESLDSEIRYLDNAIAAAEISLEEAELQRVSLTEKLKDSMRRSIKEENRLPQAEIDKLVGRAREIQESFVRKTAEYASLYSDRISLKNTAELELQRAEARHKPTHPDVIRRRNELKRIMKDGDVPLMKNSIDTLRGELIDIRKRLTFAGVSIDDEGNVLEEENIEFSSTGYLINLLNSYKLEKKNLEKQLLDPNNRVRFRLSKEARVPVEATNAKKKIILIVASVAAGIGLGLFLMVIREIIAPNPKDRWKIINKIKLPNLVTLDSRVLKKFKLLDRNTISNMKASLSKGRLAKGGPGQT